MIVKRYWHKDTIMTRTRYMGIFLFGFIPIYIEKSDWV